MDVKGRLIVLFFSFLFNLNIIDIRRCEDTKLWTWTSTCVYVYIIFLKNYIRLLTIIFSDKSKSKKKIENNHSFLNIPVKTLNISSWNLQIKYSISYLERVFTVIQREVEIAKTGHVSESTSTLGIFATWKQKISRMGRHATIIL